MKNKYKKEVVLHYDEIIEIIKTEVARTAEKFFGLGWKTSISENIVCINEELLIIPKEGLYFTVADELIAEN